MVDVAKLDEIERELGRTVKLQRPPRKDVPVADYSRTGGAIVLTNNYSQTNRDFARSNPVFYKACELAGVEPTKRQASRWRNRRGLAYAKRHEAVRELSK